MLQYYWSLTLYSLLGSHSSLAEDDSMLVSAASMVIVPV